MTMASQQAAGSSGLVPAPAAGDEDKVLKGDGTWGEAGSSVRISYDAQTAELHLDFSPLPVVKIGGHSYPYVQIGNQLWLAENLDYKWSGLEVGGSTDTTSTPHAWYYDNDESTYGIDETYKCGLLYNWYAAKYLDDNKATLLPEGWHVPTDAELTTLTDEIGGTSIGGTKLKALNNSVTSNWPSNWDGTDDYGFNALPSGNLSGDFGNINSACYYWSTTKRMENTAYFRNIQSSSSVYRDHTLITSGYSIRLVKNLT
jgi:uncharacterized protein (TIGR02145 family)